MQNKLLLLACILAFSHKVYGLTCVCMADPSYILDESSCDATGHCETDGVCANLTQPGELVRNCVKYAPESYFTGCFADTFPETNITTYHCTCNDRDNCNDGNVTYSNYKTEEINPGGKGNWICFAEYMLMVSVIFVIFI